MLRPQDLLLRCYAERESDGSWFTICIDLNLYARGDSMEEAREKLHHYLVDYLREAFGEDHEHFADLVPRKAPIYFRLRWQYARFACAVRNWRDGSGDNQQHPGSPSRSIPFQEPMPVTLAAAA